MSQNPAGLKSIDHLEFTVDSFQSPTVKLFSTMGFIKTAENSDSRLYTQGQVRFLVKASKDENELSRIYLHNHGEGVSKISFKVESVEKALEITLKNGAKLISDLKVHESSAGLTKTASIQGFGDVVNEFVERPDTEFRPGFMKLDNDTDARPLKMKVSRIDHLTNNSKVVQLTDNSIIIPINEPEIENGKSQIQEFLDVHRGPGVQHIALMTPDIITTVGELRERAVKFLSVPGTYYEDLPKRPFKITEELETLRALNLLADGDHEGYLLQIFSETYIGPLFFEYIQRKNHWGFGNGNFQALFDAIERDQMRRGYL